jgi:hypothetical protein
MKTHLLILLMAVATTALGQVATAKPSPSPAPSFESPRLVETKRFIPADSSRENSTGSTRALARPYNDGLVNTYFLQAEGTEFGKGQTYQTKVR